MKGALHSDAHVAGDGSASSWGYSALRRLMKFSACVTPLFVTPLVCMYASAISPRTWNLSKYQMWCQTQEIGNGDPWNPPESAPEWSNELGGVFWVACAFQEGQNVTGGRRGQGNLPPTQPPKMSKKLRCCPVHAYAPNSGSPRRSRQGSSSTSLGWTNLYVEDHHQWQEFGLRLQSTDQTAVLAVEEIAISKAENGASGQEPRACWCFFFDILGVVNLSLRVILSTASSTVTFWGANKLNCVCEGIWAVQHDNAPEFIPRINTVTVVHAYIMCGLCLLKAQRAELFNHTSKFRLSETRFALLCLHLDCWRKAYQYNNNLC